MATTTLTLKSVSNSFYRPLRDEEKLPVPSHRYMNDTLLPMDDVAPEDAVSPNTGESKRKSLKKSKERSSQGKEKKTKHKRESKKKSALDGERQRGVGSEDVKVCN